MIVYVLFVHLKSVSKKRVCIIFKKNLKKFWWVFLGGFFWVGFLLPTLGPGRRNDGHARPGPRFAGRSDSLLLVGFRGGLLRETGEGEQSAVAGDQEPAAGPLFPLLRSRGHAHQRLGGYLPWRKERVFRICVGIAKENLNFSLKGLSHEIDFKNFDKNLQNLA